MDYLTINSQLGFRLPEIMVKLTIISGSDSRIYRRVSWFFWKKKRSGPWKSVSGSVPEERPIERASRDAPGLFAN